MAHKVIDRCKETTSTTGTGTLTLTGAVANFVAMADATAGLTTNGDTSWFCAENGAEWEVFLGTRLSSTTLARTTVISSSNAGAAVSFTAAPTVFGTVPASKLSTVGPAFSAIKNATQSIAATTFTKVTFQVEEFDTDSAFDSTTNYRFQPNVAGYYQISGRVGTTTVFAANSLVAIYKNGANHKAGVQPNSSAYGMPVSALVYLNGDSDYVELYVYLSAALTLAGNGQENYFQGAMVRRA